VAMTVHKAGGEDTLDLLNISARFRDRDHGFNDPIFGCDKNLPLIKKFSAVEDLFCLEFAESHEVKLKALRQAKRYKFATISNS
jgi:hypothetical protein